MAGKKDKSLIYWNMNYKGKLRRTWVMLPICIIVGIIAPFYTANQYGSVMLGIVFDVVLAVVWVLQLLYNMKKAKSEAEQNERIAAQQNFQTPQGAPAQGGFATPNAPSTPNGPNAYAQNPYGQAATNAQTNQQYVPPMPANVQQNQPAYPGQPYPQQNVQQPYAGQNVQPGQQSPYTGQAASPYDTQQQSPYDRQ
ncbi:hypothetical protein KIH77_07845 [Bifidobacterium sp. 82T24]|uniref:hypothetical protein n=1 Tax=Bifidobacterium pluvialisilvae TaxID=2834436 RepID=UPI001C56B76A|nr:hypothetical protein [Bifidobacterium pluvialisilvae]MBW3088638.1 hypothetical protein [Bifidobacterium pluvialisilvae]